MIYERVKIIIRNLWLVLYIFIYFLLWVSLFNFFILYEYLFIDF